MSEKHAVLYRMNWDDEFYHDMQSGLGFEITEPTVVTMDETKEKTLYGARSPLYGTTYGDERAFSERFRCRCGMLHSKQYEGEICPKCKSPVEEKGNNIRICGYISLVNSGAHAIQPLYFRILAQAIGKDFSEIVICKKIVDTDGNQRLLKAEDLDYTPSHPFYGIGLTRFYERYDEIMDYYLGLSSKKNKRETLQMLKDSKRSVFTQHIPIYSTFMRPESITQDTFYYQGADKMINIIYRLKENLENCNEIEWDFNLQRLQIKLNQLWDYDFETVHKKEGIIRDMILGGSLNYTARNVIICDPSLRDNEIDLSYHTFRDLFKTKIISYLTQYEDLSMSEAEDRWEKSFSFDAKIYEIMQLIIKNEDISVLINRNPTLRKLKLVS